MTLTPALLVAKKMRMPRFEKGTSPRVKVEQLETYLLESAFAQGELSEERLDRLLEVKRHQEVWDHIDISGYPLRTRTEAAVRDAKRQVNPNLYNTLTELEWTIKRLVEEIDRLERDATKVSRVYSMMTGS